MEKLKVIESNLIGLKISLGIGLIFYFSEK